MVRRTSSEEEKMRKENERTLPAAAVGGPDEEMEEGVRDTKRQGGKRKQNGTQRKEGFRG